MPSNKELKELEGYLSEQPPLLKDIDFSLEKIQEYQQILTTVSQMDQSTVNLVKGIKDSKTHNAGGVIALYSTYDGLKKALDEAVPKLDSVYKINVDGLQFNIKRKSLEKLWNYRLNWAEEGIGHLYFLYKDDIAKYIQEQEDVFERIKNRYEK